MGFWGWTILIVVAVFALSMLAAWAAEYDKKRLRKMPLSQRKAVIKARAEASASVEYGQVKREVVCPHCDTKGKVHTKTIKQKKGVSGGKATAAILTGGISMLATGLSRKEANTQAHCRNCDSTWFF